MGEYISFIEKVHHSTSRNYLERGSHPEKAKRAEVAKEFGEDYWDGARCHGYGGYHYDGRWKAVAEKMISHYQLNQESKILDIGCGKAFLLYEIKKLLPQTTVCGIDISQYALDHCKEEMKPFVQLGHAHKLDFQDSSFDLIVSNMTLHNLEIFDLFSSLKEIERVRKKDAWICVESFRNEKEKINMINWQLTCNSFYNTEEWQWIFKENDYKGDYEFGFFL